MDYTWHYDSPIGGITLASDGEALVGLWFDGQAYSGEVTEAEHREKMLPVFEESCRWLDLYFGGSIPGFTPLLKLRTSAFRKRVWEIMLSIPYGQTMTYGEIAGVIARERGEKQMSAQAVGGAVGHNPISLIIPCHRVVGANGKLTGYAGGIFRKEWLLEMEGVSVITPLKESAVEVPAEVAVINHLAGHTAVNADILTSDETGLVGAEVHHHIRDIEGIADTSGRLLRSIRTGIFSE